MFSFIIYNLGGILNLVYRTICDWLKFYVQSVYLNKSSDMHIKTIWSFNVMRPSYEILK